MGARGAGDAAVHRQVSLPPAGEPVAFSRVGTPSLRIELAGRHPIIDVPAVAGHTVWEYGRQDATAVVEQVNWVGREEAVPGGRRVHVIERAVEPAQVEAARNLRKALVQVRGVTPPWEPVEAPWFVILVPCEPAALVSRVPFAEPLALAELPGGVRIEGPEDASPAAVRQYAAGFEAAILAIRGGS